MAKTHKITISKNKTLSTKAKKPPVTKVNKEEKQHINIKQKLEKLFKLDKKKSKKENQKVKIVVSKELILAIFTIVFGIIVVIGTTYAAFSTLVKGSKAHSVVAGTLNINFTEGQSIKLENAYPVSDSKGVSGAPYTFTIKNTGNVDAMYRIKFEEDTSNPKNMLPKNVIKITYRTGTNSFLTPNLLSDLNNVLVTNQTLSAGQSITYDIKMWINETAGNEIQGKSYKAKVVVEAVQKVEGEYQDTIPPVITLSGNVNQELKKGATYTESGVSSVRDDIDGTIATSKVTKSYEYYNGSTTSTVSSVNTNNVGVYYITYKVSDNNGNQGVAVRTVTVNNPDTVAPTLTLNGSTSMSLVEGTTYTESGYTASDSVDGSLTNKVVVIGTPNIHVPGSYVIKYIAMDQAGNFASKTRTVTVTAFTSQTFSYSGSIVVFNVPATATYTIETWGASGGKGASNTSAGRTSTPGRGAKIKGDFSLNAGDQLLLLVGQAGTDYTYSTSLTDGTSGAGGGGTFVAKKVTSSQSSYSMSVSGASYNGWYVSPLIIAGGGNGGGDAAYTGQVGTNYYHAMASTGSAPTYNTYCGGGFSTAYTSLTYSGGSFLTGGQAATTKYTRPSGTSTAGSAAGFGGGGANRDDGSGGGGGGYYGGCSMTGGAGTSSSSYNSGNNTSIIGSGTSGNLGNGKIVITKK